MDLSQNFSTVNAISDRFSVPLVHFLYHFNSVSIEIEKNYCFGISILFKFNLKPELYIFPFKFNSCRGFWIIYIIHLITETEIKIYQYLHIMQPWKESTTFELIFDWICWSVNSVDMNLNSSSNFWIKQFYFYSNWKDFSYPSYVWHRIEFWLWWKILWNLRDILKDS